MRARNHWSVHSDDLVFWKASVPLAADRPDELLSWTRDVIVLADELGVAEFRRDDGSTWSRAELLSYISERLENERVVDAFGFSRGFLKTRSRLAYYADDGIAESMIDDAGALLSNLRDIDEDQNYAAKSCSPLWVSGHMISYGSSPTGLSVHDLPMAGVQFSFNTDIWLPWVPGQLDADDVDVFYDNRELCHRHSTRLNKFFYEVRRMSIGRGGSWRYDNYTEPSWLDYLTGPEGIKLVDEPLPMSLSPFNPARWRDA